MDIKRDPAVLRRKKIRRAVIFGLVVVVLGVVTYKVMQLQPAAPTALATGFWYDTVKRGPMVRNVRGAGTLVPEEIRWVSATSSGRVERIVLRPGAIVKRGTVIVELTNPDLVQQVSNAELAYKTGQALLANAQSTMDGARLVQKSSLIDAESQLKLSKVQLDAQQTLFAQGLASDITIKQLQAQVDSGQNRVTLIKEQIKMSDDNKESQIAPQIAQVSQLKAAWEQFQRNVDDLKVKSTMDGVLQIVPVQEGQAVGSGTNMARVADPSRLKAEIRISETQTKDLAIGQPAEIDTRNGIVKGHVSRIDPASAGGTVGVDVTLDGPLPPGARPDLSVEGTIELQRLEDILYVQRPSFGQEGGTISVFKLVSVDGQPVPNGQEAGHEAIRTPVTLGVASVMFIEVKQGLAVGDRIVLSDMSAYDLVNRIRLN